MLNWFVREIICSSLFSPRSVKISVKSTKSKGTHLSAGPRKPSGTMNVKQVAFLSLAKRDPEGEDLLVCSWQVWCSAFQPGDKVS